MCVHFNKTVAMATRGRKSREVGRKELKRNERGEIFHTNPVFT